MIIFKFLQNEHSFFILIFQAGNQIKQHFCLPSFKFWHNSVPITNGLIYLFTSEWQGCQLKNLFPLI